MELYDFVSYELDTDKLKCFVCQNYLSHFPISLCSNNQSVCGRCDIPEATIAFQNKAFEGLCRSIKFPCRYEREGCPETLVPLDVPKHEKSCPFRVVPCIISKPVQCEWKGSLQTFTKHCSEKHSDVISKNGEFMIDMSVSDEGYSLLERNDVFYMFTREFDAESTTLYCAVYNIEYETVGKSVSARVSVKKEKKRVSIDFQTASSNETVYTDLCLQSLISKNEAGNLVSGEVEIEPLELAGYRLDEETNSVLLSMLKCSVCGLSSNNPCLNPVCSTCTGLYPLENINLDDLAKLVKYPCGYHESGCTFTSMLSSKLSHEESCNYRNENCPLLEYGSCNWKGLKKDISDHVSSNHHDLIVSSGDILQFSEKDTEMKCLFVRFSDRLFPMVFCYQDSLFLWSVQNIDWSKKDFRYQIEILGSKNTDREFSMRKNCSKLTGKKDVFKKFNCCFCVTDQACGGLPVGSRPLVSFRFRVRVLK